MSTKPHRFLHPTSLQRNAFKFLDVVGHPGQDQKQVCPFYAKGICYSGSNCPLAHINSSRRTLVCKHYLRGTCKKGDDCDYLHSYDLSKMAECFYFNNSGECNNPDCLFRHVDPSERAEECPFYLRGFCKWGPSCKNRHSPKKLCPNYFYGFCPDGPDCALTHPPFKYELDSNNKVIISSNQSGFNQNQSRFDQNSRFNKFRNIKREPGQIICFFCGVEGHKTTDCPKKSQMGNKPQEIECFKCGETGHYANNCPNGFRPNKYTDPRKVRGRVNQSKFEDFITDHGHNEISEQLAREQQLKLIQEAKIIPKRRY